MKKTFFNFSASVLPYVTAVPLTVYIIFYHTNVVFTFVGAVVAVWFIAFGLKVFFHKLRPHNTTASAPFMAESKYSFPSEHSAIFATLGILTYSVEHTLGVVIIFIAFLIGISRAIIEVHFWRDIIVGWILGIIVALFFI